MQSDLKQFRLWPPPLEYDYSIYTRRAQAVVSAKDNGMTFRAIGDELNLSPARVGKIYREEKARMANVCPCCGRPL